MTISQQIAVGATPMRTEGASEKFHHYEFYHPLPLKFDALSKRLEATLTLAALSNTVAQIKETTTFTATTMITSTQPTSVYPTGSDTDTDEGDSVPTATTLATDDADSSSTNLNDISVLNNATSRHPLPSTTPLNFSDTLRNLNLSLPNFANSSLPIDAISGPFTASRTPPAQDAGSTQLVINTGLITAVVGGLALVAAIVALVVSHRLQRASGRKLAIQDIEALTPNLTAIESQQRGPPRARNTVRFADEIVEVILHDTSSASGSSTTGSRLEAVAAVHVSSPVEYDFLQPEHAPLTRSTSVSFAEDGRAAALRRAVTLSGSASVSGTATVSVTVSGATSGVRAGKEVTLFEDVYGFHAARFHEARQPSVELREVTGSEEETVLYLSDVVQQETKARAGEATFEKIPVVEDVSRTTPKSEVELAPSNASIDADSTVVATFMGRGIAYDSTPQAAAKEQVVYTEQDYLQWYPQQIQTLPVPRETTVIEAIFSNDQSFQEESVVRYLHQTQIAFRETPEELSIDPKPVSSGEGRLAQPPQISTDIEAYPTQTHHQSATPTTSFLLESGTLATLLAGTVSHHRSDTSSITSSTVEFARSSRSWSMWESARSRRSVAERSSRALDGESPVESFHTAFSRASGGYIPPMWRSVERVQ
ncbi:hypothetical protein BC830DRAFT_1155484, partial [Chytriomyces sp. MP71]